ncbi:acyl-CoA reductase [Olivibacter sitiensis]|uniref:acyl-CoA reductase n=1 Tax=Olivibacter sitiensis TaxID=376470 RepID=UPI001B7F7D39|nr:acyl-CoA reductase [Olivibacter sitiensis]
MQEAHDLPSLISTAAQGNPWFTTQNVQLSIRSWADKLTIEKLDEWLAPYSGKIAETSDKVVGLVLAGNIPMVGWHDVLATLLIGLKVQIKLSSDDKLLIPHFLSKLIEIEPAFSNRIDLVERLQGIDIIIATGSNNTSRYFDYYFGKYPHIIRKNRNGIAVLTGKETTDEIVRLGHDIFDYFGLGCRNVSKIYVPKEYDFKQFFEPLEHFSDISLHHKYHNNYDYNKSIYLVNGDVHYDNGFLLLKEDTRIASPLAVVYYESYDNINDVAAVLQNRSTEIQCIVAENNSIEPLSNLPVFTFGQTQYPALDDYADGVNTVQFLIENIN